MVNIHKHTTYKNGDDWVGDGLLLLFLGGGWFIIIIFILTTL